MPAFLSCFAVTRCDAVWLFAIALVLFACAGCSRDALDIPGTSSGDESAPLASDSSAQMAALAVLDSMQQGAFQDAFERLGRYGFVRRVQSEQFSATGAVTASEARTVRYGFQQGERVQTVTERDSSGAFDFGFLGRFVSSGAEADGVEDPTRFFFPEDPPYRSPRSRTLYTYRIAPDTLWDGRVTRVVTMTATPEARANQSLRRARFYIDAQTRQMVGFAFERLRQTMLFDEASRTFFRLEPAPDSGWVPALTRAHVRTRFPLSGIQQFRSTSAYSEYALP